MLSEIADAILYKLQKEGLDTNELDFESLVAKQFAGFGRPNVSIAIPSIGYQRVKMNTMKCIPIYSLFLLVCNVSSEKMRTKLMMELIEGIHTILLYKDLGLNLENKITPVSANDTTPKDFADVGCVIYEIKLTCSFVFNNIYEDDKGQGLLLAINNKYFLQPDDGVLDNESELDFSTADGGNAFSIYYDSMDIDGGIAGTEDYYENELNGGTSGSKYNA